MINQPAPELSKRRQINIYLAGASPLMHKRRINSFNSALFIRLAQTRFDESTIWQNYFSNVQRNLRLKTPMNRIILPGGNYNVKILSILIICLHFGLNIFGQDIVSADQSGVAELYLLKDNGEGKAGEKVESIFTNEVPIHCVVQLTSNTPVTVKMNFIAVKVAGVKPETKVFTISYKTKDNQSRVNFTGKPEGSKWVAGTYRIDILLDDKPAKNLTFEIYKTPKELETESNPKPKTPTKPVRKFRKSSAKG
jgi:hypothetical protein